MLANTPVLEVRDLSVRYGALAAVAQASFSIAPGEIVGLTGDSGSGKSSLALALLGLVRSPGRIAGGSVSLAGTDLLALPEHARRQIRGRDIGLIVQNSRSCLSPLHTVGRQLRTTLQAHGALSGPQAAQRGVALLRSLGLNDAERRMRAYPHEISGGMAQRVLIAMALGAGPRLLVADEPTSGLDVTIQAQFLDDLWRTVRDAGSAALLMTQDLGIIANYCDRMLVMQDGRIVGSGPTRAMFAAPEDAYSRAVLSLRHEGGPPATPESAELLSVRGLNKAFPLPGGKRVQAVSDVAFTLSRGETLAVVGESGSGKTTLGRCLLRLVEPDSGEVVFEGASVTGASAAAMRAIRGRMRVVFQDPFDQLDPRWTVQTILSEALPHPTVPALRDLLALVGLEPAVLRQKPRTLSVGVQQRVSIARAIAVRPSLIVLDEPTSALTPLARVEIIRLLHRLQADLGMSFLFISHDLDTVEHLSHRVAVMYLGQVVELGTREQIFRDPRHPYSQALLGAQLVPDPANRRVDRGEGGALSGEIPSPIDLPPGCYLASRCPVARPACATTPQALVTLPDGRSLRCGPAAMAA